MLAGFGGGGGRELKGMKEKEGEKGKRIRGGKEGRGWEGKESEERKRGGERMEGERRQGERSDLQSKFLATTLRWPGASSGQKMWGGHTWWARSASLPGVPKSGTLLISEFSTLKLLVALFAIFVYLHIIFIKCLISEPSVVSIQMDSPAGWCIIVHCEQHDKLPQNGECFIHRASDVASKQPWFKPRWLCCLGCSSAASLA